MDFIHCVPSLHCTEGPICPIVPLRTPAEFPPGPQSSPAQPRPVHAHGRQRSTSQCTSEQGGPAKEYMAWAGYPAPVWVPGQSTAHHVQYSVKPFVLIILGIHGTGPISRSSPPGPVPLPVVPVVPVLPPPCAPSHAVPLCRENAVKLPSEGPPQGCETRQAQNTPEPTAPPS